MERWALARARREAQLLWKQEVSRYASADRIGYHPNHPSRAWPASRPLTAPAPPQSPTAPPALPLPLPLPLPGQAAAAEPSLLAVAPELATLAAPPGQLQLPPSGMPRPPSAMRTSVSPPRPVTSRTRGGGSASAVARGD
ncbi:unnamed protein product, partial [Phaeothamnion confervicola]